MTKESKSIVGLVAAIAPAAALIEPPEGWTHQSPLGMLRFDASPSGRLVRLADLVLWLMKTNELPCGVAVEQVCEALQADGAADWLYLLDSAGYATLLSPNHSFDSGHDFAPPPAVDDAGMSGALKNMRVYWGKHATLIDGSTYVLGQDAVEPLAMRLDKAFALWGYGRRAAPVTEVAAESDAWTGKMLAAQKAAYVAAGHRDHTQKLVKLTGLKARTITGRIAAASLSGAGNKKATPFDGLGGSATGKKTKANRKS